MSSGLRASVFKRSHLLIAERAQGGDARTLVLLAPWKGDSGDVNQLESQWTNTH